MQQRQTARRWWAGRPHPLRLVGMMSGPVDDRKPIRWAGLVGAVIVVAAALVTVQLAAAAPASAVAGIQRVLSTDQVIDSQATKSAHAYCPETKHVIGGGGWVAELGAAPTRRVTLTQLQPIRLLDGIRDGYVATGAETFPGITGDWYVVAYALCANKNALSQWDIVPTQTFFSSESVQTAAAVCPAGTRVLGTGGKIVNPGGQVALQVARASASGDIARVQAHEDADGYSGDWSVVSYAVCVTPPPGYQVVYGQSGQIASEPEKDAFAVCPGSKVVHGAGGAITNVAPGNVSLRVVYPSYDPKRVDVLAVENTPTNQNWDFIVAQAICAY
jgi:hypothetical protein